MLLDVAGYGLFDNTSIDWAVIGKVLTAGLGIIFGGIALAVFCAFALLGIVALSIRRGIVNRSVPKTIGAFFRLAGILAGVVFAIVFIPFALLLKMSIATALMVSALIVLFGFLAGRTISKLIGWRLQKYGFYLRAIDILRNKIVRIVYSI